MVGTLPTLPNLDGLIGLARQDGVDVRPTLVRVLTDLYVQKPAHTREEEHRFTELTLWLLTGVDVSTRTAVAKKLAAYAHAPQAVVRRLARDVFAVAEPVLRFSPCLTSEDLLAIITDFGPRYAAAIGTRGSSPAADAPAEHEPVASAGAVDRSEQATRRTDQRTGIANQTREPGSAGSTPTDSRPGPAKAEPVALGDYFLGAASPERRLLLANLDDGTVSRSEQALAAKSKDIVVRLEAAALEQRPEAFVRELEQMGIPAHRARTIVDDEIGEPVIVLAKALAVPPDILLRILLFLNPIIGHSVERVFDLVNLYDQLSTQAALHIVSSWQNRPSGEQRKGGYQALHWDDERRGARRTFAEHGRRFPLQVPAPGISNQESAIRKGVADPLRLLINDR